MAIPANPLTAQGALVGQINTLREQRAGLADALAQGAAHDFADYRHRCGQIAGLDVAIHHAATAIKRSQAPDAPQGVKQHAL